MNSVLQPEIISKTAEEFLDTILPAGKYFREKIDNSTWLFRGQGKDYELIPSLFRKDEKKLKRLTKRNVAGSYGQLLLAERDFIDDFFSIADKRGFLIPDDSQELRFSLANVRKHDHDILNKNGEWLSSGRLLSLVALAQHYGIPTRLLDWTMQSLAAAFFAAEGGVKRFDQKEEKFSDPEDPIVLWAFHFPLFGVNLNNLSNNYSLKGVTAPSSSNPNLKAQQGVFTLAHHWYTNEKENNYLPFHKIIENINTSGYSRDVEGCELQKITLPVSESFKLINLLKKLDVAPSSIYPGYHSIIADMKLQKNWEDYG